MGMGSGGPGNAATGITGYYPQVAEAYRRAADFISKRDGMELLLRELQSIAWEAIRGVWSAKDKND
jgi:hypothetical protein